MFRALYYPLFLEIFVLALSATSLKKSFLLRRIKAVLDCYIYLNGLRIFVDFLNLLCFKVVFVWIKKFF
jgi:hypothetical protein